MAASKKKKVVKCKQPPQTGVAVEKDPNRFFGSSPSWKFSGADMDPGCSWSICKQHLQNAFWDEVLTRLRAFESMSYEEIFVQGKKHHHEIDVLQLSVSAVPEKSIHKLGVLDTTSPAMSIMDIAGLFVML